MTTIHTFHLYHHQPGPLPLDEVADQAWLINNALTYTVVAVIQAPGVAEALQAAQCKATSRPLPRRTAVQSGNVFRETLPGDVLVAENAAWMGDGGNQVRPIPYTLSRSWKRLHHRPGQQAAVDTLAWSPDGSMLAAAASDCRVSLHLVTSDELYPGVYDRGEGYSVTALAWSPRGSQLAAAHHNGDVHVWKPNPRQHGGATGSILICRPEERVRFLLTAHCVAWSPDGARLFAGYDDGLLVPWDASTGACLLSQEGYHHKAITTLAFAPHNEFQLLSASADTHIQIWDRAADLNTVYQHAAGVTAATWSPDGSLVASCERDDPTIHLWNPQTGMVLERLPLSISSTELPNVCALAWSPDGRVLAAGCDDSTIQFIDLAQHRHVHTYRVDVQDRRRIEALAWSPDGSMLAATDRSIGIAIWQVKQDLEAAQHSHPMTIETNPSPLRNAAEQTKGEPSC